MEDVNSRTIDMMAIISKIVKANKNFLMCVVIVFNPPLYCIMIIL